ncbi:MAG: KamA family radical SAM protein [Dehalococcoidia bacterium]
MTTYDRATAYRAYTNKNVDRLPQAALLTPEQLHAIRVVSQVLPFKTNSYVVEELIRWDDVPNDPMFVLTFPQKDMLTPEHFAKMERALERGPEEAGRTANEIRLELNPHPAGQLEHNVPELYGQRLPGMQHKYRETVLFFPSNGQTCHAFCSFCFRWPQFVGDPDMKFAARESQGLVNYLRAHPEVNNVLITGGDPMVMSARHLEGYLRPLLDADLANLMHIRIGTKSLSYWPYRYLHDRDSDDILRLFEEIGRRGLHLSIMAHFNHPRELDTWAVREAIGRIRDAGAEIRTQSPIMAGINDRADAWAKMWKLQVNLGCIPYYMFLARDTGAQHFFGVPLVRAHEIYRDALSNVSGLARTVRGPSMSADPGKIQVLGPADVDDRKVLTLQFLQGRDPAWVGRPFFAEYDDSAAWLDELRPAFGERFFFEEPA